MRCLKILFIVAVFLQLSCGKEKHKEKVPEKPIIEFYGLEVRVNNFEESLDFYKNKLGFSIKQEFESPKRVEFDSPEMPFFLVEVNGGSNIDWNTESKANATFQVNKLLHTIDELRSKEVNFITDRLRRNGVGISIPLIDPSNNFHTIIEVQIRDVPEFKEPKIYNTGFSVPDMDVAKEFYVNTLGFKVFSESYLPAALPLKHSDDRFAFMLHYNASTVSNSSISSPDQSQTMLVFSTNNFEEALSFLKESNIDVFELNREEGRVYFKDPFGNFLKLIKK